MTCSEVHACFHDDPRAALSRDSAKFLDHIASCQECDRFVAERRELARRLHLARNHAPPLPASVDALVLAQYRSYVLRNSRPSGSVLLASRINLRGAYGWAAAVSFAAVVAYGALFLLRPADHVDVHRGVAERPPVMPRQATAISRKPMVSSHKEKRPFAALAAHANMASSVARQDNSLPMRFQSLMYCDELSCPGAMDVIRVQLPSPVLGLSSPSANGSVSADVLVGPDGIARGIRLVE